MRCAVLVLGLGLIGPGCATSQSTELAKLRQRLDELAQAQDDSHRQIEALNNRIFLLEDKVDTGRVAMERRGDPPRLPVIRLTPEPSTEHGSWEDDRDDRTAGQSAPSSAAAAAEDHGDQPGSLVERRDVTYAGAATRSGPRPVLRLHGRPSAARSARAGRSAAPADDGPDPEEVDEHLGVVPLPRRAKARQLARQIRPMKAYQSALSMYRSGKYTAAAKAFEGFVGRYGEHSYADNALYWLGECFYDMKNFRLALTMFRRVVDEYPSGNKAPDAMLKIGFCYLKLDEKNSARTVLAKLMDSYPKSRVAGLASKALTKIQ